MSVVEAEIRTQEAIQRLRFGMVAGDAIFHTAVILPDVNEPQAQHARIPAVLKAFPAVGLAAFETLRQVKGLVNFQLHGSFQRR